MEIKEEAVTDKKEKTENPIEKKRWIGKGIYGKGDVSIKILDGMIGVFIVVIIVLIVAFALNGGYHVTFETDGGSEVAGQKLDYGEHIQVPDDPIKPGYRFVHWVTSQDEYLAEVWDFSENKIEEDTTLYAVWEPAEIIVKFDADGGVFPDGREVCEKQVVYGETYGELPVPMKEGYVFEGWVYSQQTIEEDTIVSMTGEHVLTASWIAR